MFYTDRCIQILNEAGLLNDENRAIVVSHVKPKNLFLVILKLQQAEILTEANFAVVSTDANPLLLADALLQLQQAKILTEENRAMVVDHANPLLLADALSLLYQAEILTEENRAKVVEHINPDGLDVSLFYLLKIGILTQTNFALVANYPHPRHLADAFYYLQQARILTEANFALIVTDANLNVLVYALSSLQQAGILTQENFTALFALNHAAIVSEQAVQMIWGTIPYYRLTQGYFEILLIAAEQANPMDALQLVVNQILGIQAQAGAGHAAVVNHGQSIHTASVHRSVSAAAEKLWSVYGAGLSLEAKIAEMKAFVYDLYDSFKHDAVKRCIERITAVDYTYVDHSSGVSIRQLLALAYIAIHDEAKRSGSLEDAKALFVDGLYEIQRGYNLNAAGEDDNSLVDSSICVAGTFNKIMEKLNGIHQEVEIFYITPASAAAKFPKIVEEKVGSYLKSLVNPATIQDYQMVKSLLDTIQSHGSIEMIWAEIKDKVETELWDEFKEAFANNRSATNFVAIIASGIDISAPDLSVYQTQIQASPGSLAYHEALGQHSLWAERQSSAEAQREFDKEFGLVCVSRS